MVVANPASQVVAALTVGLLLAFTCQLLLTNLGLAVGITLWGGKAWTTPPEALEEAEDADESGEPDQTLSASTLSFAAGLGLLLTINGVLFVASYAAVSFCSPVTAFAGGILGLAIWAAYLLAMTWISTSAANSLVGFILSSAVSGLRQIFTVLSAVMQSVLGDDSSDSPPALLTPAAVSDLVRQETQASLSQLDIPTLIDEYIDERLPPQYRLDTLQPQAEQALQRSELAHREQQGLLPPVSLSTFTDWLEKELGMVGEMASDLAERLYQVWQRVTGRWSPLQEVQALFATAPVDELTPEAIRERLGTHSGVSAAEPDLKATGSDISRQLRRSLRQRLDLSDLDLQAVWQRAAPLLQDWLQDDTPASLTNQVVKEDVEDYLEQVPPWRLESDALQQEFQEVLVDPEAAASQVLPQVSALAPDDFAHSLEQRGDLSQTQIEELVTMLEGTRQDAIAALSTPDAAAPAPPDLSEAEQEAVTALQQKLEDYLHYTSLSQITPAAIAEKVEALVEESALPPQTLRQVAPTLPPEPLNEVLSSRQGLEPAQQAELVQQVQQTWRQQTAGDRGGRVNPQVQVAVEGALILGISQLISRRVTGKDLLSALMEPLQEAAGDPQDLRHALSQTDWGDLSQRAKQQLNATETQVTQATQQVQTALTDFLKPPKRWVLRRSAQVHDFWSQVTDYLTHSRPEQLSAEAIRENLEWLWRTSGRMDALQRFSAEAVAQVQDFDRETLKAAVAQRSDLSTQQVEDISAALEAFTRDLLRRADQVRQQAQAALQDWLKSVALALQDPDQLAFDPGRIKQELRSLLQRSPELEAVSSAIQPLKLLNASVSASEDIAGAIAQMGQDALTQVLKAQGVSEAMLTQAAALKDWLQTRVNGMVEELRDRQLALQQAALQQLNEARKALATAAWWLFAIAVSSALSAAGAGILAVVGVAPLLTQLGG
ncbi:MAG: hypothetical protein AAF289_06655 [Cyanobacteria bacterium P01_A01_bin.135]